VTGGLGLSPNSDAPKCTTYNNLNKFFHIDVLRTTHRHAGWVAFAKNLPYAWRSRVRPPWTPQNFKQTTFNMVPRGNPCLGHVAPPNLPSTFHKSKSNSFTCLSIKFLPRKLFPIITYHVSNCTDCTAGKFLPVWKIKHNTISPSYSVCLKPFKVSWVRDNEAYTPVHFEASLSTLNFEQNLIPWINNSRSRGCQIKDIVLCIIRRMKDRCVGQCMIKSIKIS
jgi:hypothetical protein